MSHRVAPKPLWEHGASRYRCKTPLGLRMRRGPGPVRNNASKEPRAQSPNAAPQLPKRAACLARLIEIHGMSLKKLASSPRNRSEEHTSELQSLMRISYAVFCLKKKKKRQR